MPALAEESDVRVRAPAASGDRATAWADCPSKAQAAQQLYDLARSYFAGKQTMRTDIDGRVTLWTWDPATKQCTPRNCAPDDAARAVAARLARAARSLAPDNRQVQMLALAAALEQMVYDRGLDKRLDFKDPTVRADRRDGSADDRRRAGLLPGRAPSGRGAGGCRNPRPGRARPQDLLQGGSEPSPLVRAVRSPDRRLRMAALEAIVDLAAARRPFAGSSHVLESLAYLAASTGGRRALVVSPSTETFEEWVGVLRFRNIATDPAATGREAVRMALRCPDYELVVIDMATQARRRKKSCSSFTRTIARPACGSGWSPGPVSSSGPSGSPRTIRLTIAFSQPIDAEAARWQLGQLMRPDAAGVRRLFRAAGPGRAGLGLPGEAGQHVRQALSTCGGWKMPCWPACWCRA